MNFHRVSTGHKFLEAGRVDEDGALFFSDYALGGVHRLDADGSVQRWLPDLRGIGGLALNDDGRLVVSSAEGVWLFDPASGRNHALLREVEGQERSFNDIEPDGQGGLFLGTIDLAARSAGTAPRYGELVHLSTDGSVLVLRRDIGAANGIGLSPDGTSLYLSDTGTGLWRHVLSRSTLTLEPAELIAEFTDSDGLEVDGDGNIWVACWQSAMVRQFAPDGMPLGDFAIPEGQAMTLSFAGADLSNLYIFAGADVTDPESPATASIYRVEVEAKGRDMAKTSFR